MIVTTQNEFAEYEITETLGLVLGNTIRSRHVGKDILAGLPLEKYKGNSEALINHYLKLQS